MTLGPPPINLPTITTADLVLAATLLVLPQVPLTLANSCLAPADAAPRYFPDAASRITPSRLARTLGAANLAVGAISGMPLCHGAGGMSAHHAFGARTWRAPALIGAALTTLALAARPRPRPDPPSVPPGDPRRAPARGRDHPRPPALRRPGAVRLGTALAIGVAGATGHLLAAVVIGLAVVAAHSKLRAGRPATDT